MKIVSAGFGIGGCPLPMVMDAIEEGRVEAAMPVLSVDLGNVYAV